MGEAVPGNLGVHTHHPVLPGGGRWKTLAPCPGAPPGAGQKDEMVLCGVVSHCVLISSRLGALFLGLFLVKVLALPMALIWYLLQGYRQRQEWRSTFRLPSRSSEDAISLLFCQSPQSTSPERGDGGHLRAGGLRSVPHLAKGVGRMHAVLDNSPCRYCANRVQCQAQ